MATGTIKKLGEAIIVEEITVVTNGSSTTYYKEFSKAVSKTGYTAVGVVGYRYNQVGLLCYRASANSGTVYIGLADRSGSGTISSLNAYAFVLWVRNDLL